MMNGGVLISEPQGAVYDAHDMIRLDTMRRQIQRMLNDKVGSLKRLPPPGTRSHCRPLQEGPQASGKPQHSIIGC